MWSARTPGALIVAIALALGGAIAPFQAQSRAVSPLSVRITSPLGRTGVAGAVRIVAQIQGGGARVGQVRFFVDHQLLGAVQEPPYALDWTDEDPFARREIVVQATDAAGNEAGDEVVLEPFEVHEAAEVTSVLLDVSVQDKEGRFVRALPPSAFRVAEDDVPQAVDVVRQEAVGATFALLVDGSSSMSRRIDFVQRTAATLAGYMSPLDRMIVAPFSRTLGPVTGPTNDRATILEALAAIRPAGGTAILDAIVHGSKLVEHSEGRRAIVLITDGYDEHSEDSFDEALQAAKAAGATVYVVGIGGVAGISIKGERLLKQLALDTGGRAFFPARDEQLTVVDDTLAADVQNRYLVTYTPMNQRIDGTWRQVSVKTTDAGHIIRTRPGYFAPKPPPIRPTIEFTVTDRGGQYLDLTRDDLEVEEQGALQQVELFQEAVDPVSIVLALDASGSMRRKEQDVIDSAQEFIGALRPQDQLAVVTFSDKVVFAHDLSTDRDMAQAAVAKYQVSGGTALYDGLSDSLARLKHVAGRRVVVVMTDGRDENRAGTGPGSAKRFDEVIKAITDTGALVFSIGLGTNVDRQTLQKLSDVSGARAFFPEIVTELPAQYRRVIDDLRRRYIVGFTSTHVQRDGSWRPVQIRIRGREEAVVRSAGGYFAPAR